MVLRKSKVLRITYAFHISTSTKIKCKLNRNLLCLIKRNKTFLDKKDKNSKEFQDVNFLKNNLDNLRNRYSQLEDYLNSLVIQNARVLDDNKFLSVEILKSRKEAEIKSEKLMLFIMTFMHRVKSLYNNQQLANNMNPNNTDVMPVNINSEFIKKELDSYFKKLQSEELNDEALKSMFERYVAQNSEQVEQFPSNLMPIGKNSGSVSGDYSNNDSFDGDDNIKSENGAYNNEDDSFDKDILQRHKKNKKI